MGGDKKKDKFEHGITYKINKRLFVDTIERWSDGWERDNTGDKMIY